MQPNTTSNTSESKVVNSRSPQFSSSSASTESKHTQQSWTDFGIDWGSYLAAKTYSGGQQAYQATSETISTYAPIVYQKTSAAVSSLWNSAYSLFGSQSKPKHEQESKKEVVTNEQCISDQIPEDLRKKFKQFFDWSLKGIAENENITSKKRQDWVEATQNAKVLMNALNDELQKFPEKSFYDCFVVARKSLGAKPKMDPAIPALMRELTKRERSKPSSTLKENAQQLPSHKR